MMLRVARHAQFTNAKNQRPRLSVNIPIAFAEIMGITRGERLELILRNKNEIVIRKVD